MMQSHYPQQVANVAVARGSSAFGQVVLWSLVFDLPLIIVQFSLRFFPHLEALFILRTANEAGTDALLLLTGLIALSCSFFAALLTTRRTGSLLPGVCAGVLARVLSGIMGMYIVWATWQDILAKFDRFAVQVAARQALGRTVVDVFVSLLFCAGAAIVGALLGRRRYVVRASLLSMRPAKIAIPSLATPIHARVPLALPPTPTPNGWQFTPYELSQGVLYQPAQQQQWPYRQVDSQRQQVPQFPLPHPYNAPQLPLTDAPTQLTADYEPTTLTPPSLPLPYPVTAELQDYNP